MMPPRPAGCSRCSRASAPASTTSSASSIPMRCIPVARWREALDRPLPRQGIGIDARRRRAAAARDPERLVGAAARLLLVHHHRRDDRVDARLDRRRHRLAAALRPHRVQLPRGAVAALARRAVRAARRWQGVYSSGGSVANLLALGAARQRAFERLGRDPAADGIDRPRRASTPRTEAHHTIQRSAGVLGIGRRARARGPLRPARPRCASTRCARRSTPTGARASCRWPSSPTPARPTPARSTRLREHRRDRARARHLVPRRRRLRPAGRARRARRAALRRASSAPTR